MRVGAKQFVKNDSWHVKVAVDITLLEFKEQYALCAVIAS